jgi:hypothetical protein
MATRTTSAASSATFTCQDWRSNQYAGWKRSRHRLSVARHRGRSRATRPQNFTGTLWVGQMVSPSVAHSSHSFRWPTGQWWLLAPPQSLYCRPQQHIAEPDVIAPLPFCFGRLGPRAPPSTQLHYPRGATTRRTDEGGGPYKHRPLVPLLPSRRFGFQRGLDVGHGHAVERDLAHLLGRRVGVGKDLRGSHQRVLFLGAGFDPSPGRLVHRVVPLPFGLGCPGDGIDGGTTDGPKSRRSSLRTA